MNFDIRLSKVNSSIAERDDSGSGVSVELIQERELLISDDTGSLLRVVLETLWTRTYEIIRTSNHGIRRNGLKPHIHEIMNGIEAGVAASHITVARGQGDASTTHKLGGRRMVYCGS